MLSEKEQIALRVVGKRSLATKDDLKKAVGDGTGFILKKLVEKQLVTEVRPIGVLCYAITTKGSKILSELE